MIDIQQLFAWYNVLFGISILIGVVFIMASVWGMDVGGDVDADIDIPDPDVEAHVAANGPDDAIVSKALGLFGIGKCPLSIILFTAFLLFGGLGLLLTNFFPPMMAMLISIGCTLIGTRIVASAVSRVMPKTETYTIKPEYFIGSTGKVTLTTSETFGQIHTNDKYGSLHVLDARTDKGSISVGQKVLIVDYNPNNNTFLVDTGLQENI